MHRHVLTLSLLLGISAVLTSAPVAADMRQGTPTATDGGACYVVLDRPSFPALVRPDGAVTGECAPSTSSDVRAFLAVQAEWTTAVGRELALVIRVELEPGGSADFGLVVNVEGGPRAVPLSAGEQWSLAGCEPDPLAPASPAAEPASPGACVVTGQASTAPAEGARIDPTTGVLFVDPATPAGRRFAVSAAFTVAGVRHERTVEVLVVPGARDSATPAEDPDTLLLRAPVVLPPGLLAVRVARYRYDAGSQAMLDSGSGSLALVVDAGSLEVEVAGPALLLPPNAPPDAQGERLVPGQRRSLGVGDQLVVAGPYPLSTWNAVDRVAEVLIIRFSDAGSSGTPPAADGVTVTVVIDGELAGVPAGPTQISLSRVELDPGTARGPIGIIVGHGFFAPEAGTLTMDLTEGSGAVREGGSVRPLAPADGTGPEAVLAPGDTAMLEPGAWVTMTNSGPGQLVSLDLIVRLEPIPGYPNPPGHAEPGATVAAGASTPT